MRGWRLLACAVAAAAVPALPAGAASQDVTANPDNTFTPANVTILQGEAVSWTNAGGVHNVHLEDNSFDHPQDPSSEPWQGSKTFLTPGVYKYYCEAHVNS